MAPITPPICPFTQALTSNNPQGLLPYLDVQIGLTFEGLEVKNYGFTGKVIDLNRLGSGFRVPEPDTEGISQYQDLCTEKIIIAKIMPASTRVQGVADTTHIDLWYFVKKQIREWVNCKAYPFLITNDYRFRVTGKRDVAAVSNLAAGDPRSLWWVLTWEFSLSQNG